MTDKLLVVPETFGLDWSCVACKREFPWDVTPWGFRTKEHPQRNGDVHRTIEGHLCEGCMGGKPKGTFP